MRKESYQIKRPEHLVIGDPWYFETVDSQKLKSLVIDVGPQKEFVAGLTIEETKYDECMTHIIFALEEELGTYLKGFMYAGQKEQVKKLPVDTAEYLIQVDDRASNIHTHEDGYWGQQLTLYSEEKGQKHPDAYIIIIGKRENMGYDSESDVYTCKNNKKLAIDHISHSKSKNGYVSEKTIYKCEDCSGCPYKSECIKGNHCKTPMEERTKTLQVAKTFLKHRKEDLERILSEDGILFRINRSIQVEGSFGDLKQDMQFRRYISKGTANVLAESTLLAMARNINKLHNKIQNNRTGTHLFPIKSA